MLRNNVFFQKATEEYSPGAHRHWERINTHCSHVKTHFLSRNLDKVCLKMLYFLEKSPQTPKLLLSLYLRVTFER